MACGEASSSVSSTNTGNGSVSSVSSAYANVTSVTLSAASDVLTQTMGTQKAVVVQAALNANTNPSLALEWFVNGTKSNQTGRVFEYTPAAAGTFEIQAKSGSVLSNKINVTVGAAALVITGDVKVVSNNKIEITAPGGATVAVTNNEVLATSFYDLAKGVYVLDLKTALTQGATSTVTLTREGLAPVSKAFTFDTRVLAIGSITGLTAKTDGSYEITKPHRLDANGVLNNAINTYTIAFEATNIGGTAPLAFSYSRTSAPVGAEAFVQQTGLRTVENGTKTTAGSFTFNVDTDTPVGTYVYTYVLGGLTRTATVVIKDTEAAITMVATTSTVTAGIDKDSVTGLLPGVTYSYNFKYDDTGDSGNTYGVPAAADGSFAIEKPFLSGASNLKTFTFSVNLTNFLVPESLIAQTSSTPNQLLVSMVDPSGLGLMRTGTGITQTALPSPVAFRVGTSGFTVSQKLDSTTPAGKYTYTVKVLQLGVEILKRDVVVELKEPQPKLSLIADEFEFEKLHTAAKTTYEGTTLVAKNALVFQADVGTFEGAVDTGGSLVTDFGGLLVDAATGTDTDINATHYGTLKTKYLEALKVALPFYSHFESSSVQSYNEAKKAWVDAFVLANPFVSGQTNTLLNAIKAKLPAHSALSADEKGLFVITLADAGLAKYNVFVGEFAEDLIESYTITLANLTTAALYRTAVESLFPAHYSIAGVTSSAKDNLVNAKLENGVYVFEKPRLSSLDTRTLVFDAVINNFQSAANPAALLAASFAGVDAPNARKDLLTFKKTVSGPVNMPNLAGNQIDSLIGIELGATAGFTLVDDLDPTSALKYYRANSATASVRLDNVFVIDASFLTVTGEYTFALQIGTLTQQIKVRVIEPVAKLDFKVLTNATNTVDVNGGFAFTLGADGKYYATMPAPVFTQSVVAKLNVVIKNTAASTANDVNYTITKVTPLTSNTDSNKVKVEAATGNDGHLVGEIDDTAGVLNAGTDQFSLLYNLIGGTYNANTAANTWVAGGVTVDNTLDYTAVTFTAKGTYSYELTINGVTSKVELVINEYPTLTVKTAKLGTTDLPKLADGNFVVEETAAATKLVYGLEAKNLPAGTLFYKVYESSTGVSDGTGTDFFLGTARPSATAPTGIETAALSFVVPTAAASRLSELKFTDGVANVDIELLAARTPVLVAIELTSTITRVYLVVAVYRVKAATRTAVANLTDATYELVGYTEIVVWVSDVVIQA